MACSRPLQALPARARCRSPEVASLAVVCAHVVAMMVCDGVCPVCKARVMSQAPALSMQCLLGAGGDECVGRALHNAV
jgi:hypothetical protein